MLKRLCVFATVVGRWLGWIMEKKVQVYDKADQS